MKTPPSTIRSWNVNGLLNNSKLCWHFHQLYRQLRFSTRESRRDEDDLGHFDDLLGNRHKRKDWSTSTNCSNHQRHRSVETLHEGRDVDRVLRGVPLKPPLRPHLDER